jgi:hypothetical protein
MTDYEARSLHFLSQIESLLKTLIEEVRKNGGARAFTPDRNQPPVRLVKQPPSASAG